MRKKIIIIIGLALIVIGLFMYYNTKNYLFTPLNFPNGVNEKFENYSYRTFKKPVLMEVRINKHENNRGTNLYYYVDDESIIRDLIKQYSSANELDGYNQDFYEKEIPDSQSYSVYTITLRQVESWDANHIANGRRLILFSFIKNSDIFVGGNGVRFYELNDGFKADIINAVKEKGVLLAQG